MKKGVRRAPIAVAMWLLLLGVPAAAQIDPYAGDPLGLVAWRDQTNNYSSGTDLWEVWICRSPGKTVGADLTQIVELLNAQITPYFSWLSLGFYSPQFVAGGVVTSSVPSTWPEQPFTLQINCELQVNSASVASPEGVLVVVDVDYDGGYARIGRVCEVASSCPAVFPANGRVVVVGGGAVVDTPSIFSPALRTIAHELGHGIFWPHSFGGLFITPSGVLYEYDNPMDVMSGGDRGTLDIGTHALNRYAAGWLDGSSFGFHRKGTATYTVGPQSMVVLPSDEGIGVYELIGARVRSGYDNGLPIEGVEVYRVDQRGPACGLDVDQVCIGPDRRTMQVPAISSPSGTAHVFGAGSIFTVRGVTVEVMERSGDQFTLRVSGAAVAERFIDDNANFHEANIELIASLGITFGCNPPLNHSYCPDRQVSRAEMAAFLLRAVGQDPGLAPYQGHFTDVPAGQWFTPYVERLFELGITMGRGDGTFGPNLPVSRAEMAAFLARAYSFPIPAPTGVFGDVAVGEWYAGFAEALLQQGITSGCSSAPLQYCPGSPVLRDQMASFIARTQG
jgi:hypothetical protein